MKLPTGGMFSGSQFHEIALLEVYFRWGQLSDTTAKKSISVGAITCQETGHLKSVLWEAVL